MRVDRVLRLYGFSGILGCYGLRALGLIEFIIGFRVFGQKVLEFLAV